MKKIRIRLYAIDLRLYDKHICEHRDCLNADIQCHLNDYDHGGDYRWKGYLHHWYCAEHCSTKKFLCWYCGEARGGCEASDFGPIGCCTNCRDESKAYLGKMPKAVRGKNSQGLRRMNINRLSHFSPPFFMGGGLTHPHPLLEYDDEEHVYDSYVSTKKSDTSIIQS